MAEEDNCKNEDEQEAERRQKVSYVKLQKDDSDVIKEKKK